MVKLREDAFERKKPSFVIARPIPTSTPSLFFSLNSYYFLLLLLLQRSHAILDVQPSVDDEARRLHQFNLKQDRLVRVNVNVSF